MAGLKGRNMPAFFGKQRRHSSSDSPKEGEKISKYFKSSRTPSPHAKQDVSKQVMCDTSQHDDITLKDIMQELKDIKLGQQELNNKLDSEIKTLREEIKEEINSRIDQTETYMKNEVIILNQTISNLTEQVDKQKKECELLKSALSSGQRNSDPLENIDVTLIASGVPEYPREIPIETARHLIDAMGTDKNCVPISPRVKVVKAIRLTNRYVNKPALLKFSVQSLEEKKLVLSNKFNLKNSTYKYVYLRSSKTHDERTQELNAKTILRNTPWG